MFDKNELRSMHKALFEAAIEKRRSELLAQAAGKEEETEGTRAVACSRKATRKTRVDVPTMKKVRPAFEFFFMGLGAACLEQGLSMTQQPQSKLGFWVQPCEVLSTRTLGLSPMP